MGRGSPRSLVSTPIKAEVNATVAPTEISISADTITNVIPSAMMPVNAAWRRIFNWLIVVRKFGADAEKITKQMTSDRSSPNSCP